MPVLVNQIADILVAINRNEQMTLVVVEQNVPMLFRMTDRFIILEKGQIVAAGSREQIAASEVMKEYLAIQPHGERAQDGGSNDDPSTEPRADST